MRQKRYALVGTGGRALTFLEPLATRYRATAGLAALCDLSQVRMDHYQRLLTGEWNHPAVPCYLAAGFEDMLREQRPDTVIVTTIDATHHDYIVRSLRAGCEVVTEKPMTVDAEKCRLILDTARATGGRVRVAFNYRWQAFRTKVRELLATGAIGAVKSVNLEYLLDTSHGADYYRRWHAHMRESGGLLVHKSTHHFDLVNWWIDAIPEQVFAHGRLDFYGRANALARGDAALAAYGRYTGAAADGDPFRLNLRDGGSLESLYLKAESESGYVRDRNVFRDDIDIYDNMSVVVRYRTGALLTYSLCSFSPREGMRVTFNGDRGRLEYHEFRGSHLIRGQSGDALAREQDAGDAGAESIRVYPHFNPSYEVSVQRNPGGHGGADPLLTEQIFAPRPPADPWGRGAGQEQGAASILVGIAANQSIASNQPVALNNLVVLRPEAHHLSELQ